MTIVQEFLDIVNKVEKVIEFPLIQEVFFPPLNALDKSCKASNFGALKLEDGTIGVIFTNLNPVVKKRAASFDSSNVIGNNPIDLAKSFNSQDDLEKVVGLGAINAITQYIFKQARLQLDFTTDSLGLLDFQKSDTIGMVGFFGPLMKKIEQSGSRVIIIEKKEHLIKKTKNWEVTLEPSQLSSCNKVLITSTTVLNDSIDEILNFCSQAEKISVIGPTGGFFPDPLFRRGVDILGGTFVHDPERFMELIRNNQKWGPSTKKYIIKKGDYEGIDALLDVIRKR